MKNLQIALSAGFTYSHRDANCQDTLGNSPLYYAASNADEAFCQYLLKLGASIN